MEFVFIFSFFQLPPRREVQRLGDLTEGLVLKAVLHLEGPDFRRAGGRERLLDDEAARGGETDLLLRLAKGREPDGVALELPLRAGQLRVAAGVKVAGEHGHRGRRVGRRDFHAFDAEQLAVAFIVVFPLFDPCDDGAEKREGARLQLRRDWRRVGGNLRCGWQCGQAGERLGAGGRASEHGVAHGSRALAPVSRHSQRINEPSPDEHGKVPTSSW